MFDENKELLDFLLKEGEIKTKELNKRGYTTYKINSLLERGVLFRVKRGYYGATPEVLEEYRKSVDLSMNDSRYYQARKRFLMALDNQYETEILESFNDLRNEAKTKSEKCDVNVYLLFLNYLYDFDREELKNIKRLKLSECFTTDNTHGGSNNIERRICFLAVHNKFVEIKNMLSSIEWITSDVVHKELIEKLSDRCMVAVIGERDLEIQLINDNKMKELKGHLLRNMSHKRLTRIDFCILKLTLKYLKYEMTGEFLKPIPVESLSVLQQIKANNFEKAYEIYQNNSKVKEYSALGFMLEKIISLTEKLNAGMEKNVDKVIESVYSEDLNGLREYLITINKEDYFSLLCNMMQADSFINNNYDLVIKALKDLNEGIFEFDAKFYVELFRQAIGDRELEKAKVFLRTIHAAKNFGVNEQIISNLEDLLECEFESDNARENVIETVDYKAEEISEKDKVCDVMETVNKKSSAKEDEILKFLDQKVDELYEGKSIIVLDVMDAKTIEKIHELVYDYLDVVSFSIGEGEEQRVVLRFCPKNDINVSSRIEQTERWISINYRDLAIRANESFFAKDYRNALSDYKRLIETRKPLDYCYYRIGVCLFNLRRFEEALDYVRIAEDINRKNGKGKSFQDFIDTILERMAWMENKTNSVDDEYKPYIKVHTSDFASTNDSCSLNNIEDLVNLLTNEGKTLDDALSELNFDDEKIAIARLIYARDCYYLERYNEGDRYLRKVQNRKNNSPIVRKMLDEISKGKRFYKNRLDESKKCLVLKRG